MMALYRLVVGMLWLCRGLITAMVLFCWWNLISASSALSAFTWLFALGYFTREFCIWWVHMYVLRPPVMP